MNASVPAEGAARSRPPADPDLWVSRSPAATERAGREFAVALAPGDVVALSGPLGSGKTRLVQGIARGLDCAGTVRSPTFTLINELHGRITLFHADLYRLDPAEVPGLALDELVERGALVVEWGEKLGPLWQREALAVAIEPGEGDERRMRPVASAGRGLALLAAWRAATAEAEGGARA